MMNTLQITLQIDELCERVALTPEDVVEIVSYGIVVQSKPQAEQWEFTPDAVALAARAARLRRDLDLNWPGVALALELLDKVDALRRENKALRQRLARFEE